MKNKKTLVLVHSKTEKYAYKAITMLVEKGHSVLGDWSKCGRSAGIKFRLKRFFKNIDTITLYLNPASKIITII
jgi:hypothetical protein